MNDLLLFFFVMQSVAVLVVGYRHRNALYQFPFLAALTFLGFLALQMPGLMNNPSIPQGAIAKFFAMCILCQAAIWFGWHLGGRKPIGKGSFWVYDDVKLTVAGVFYICVAIGMTIAFQNISDESKAQAKGSGGGGASGIATIIYFFSSCIRYGFALSFLLYLKRPTVRNATIFFVTLGLCSIFYLFSARRGPAVELGISLLCALWFRRRISISPTLFIGIALLGTVVMHNIGEIRAKLYQDETTGEMASVNSYTEIDYLGHFEELLRDGGQEAWNAVCMIEATDQTGDYDYGIFHWNKLVWNYVPAQIVGRDVKDGLTFPLDERSMPYYDDIRGKSAYGTTMTGMTDCFGSFWYLGCLKFVVIAWILRRVNMAAEAGSFAMQVAYPFLVVNGMQAITNETQYFFSTGIHMILLLMPALYLCRQR